MHPRCPTTLRSRKRKWSMSEKKKDLIDGLLVSDALRIPAKNVTRMAVIWSQRREVARNVFGPERAKEIEDFARDHIALVTPLQSLNSFEIALMVEADHPGKLEELVGRAHRLNNDTEGKVGGFVQALMMVLLTERSKRE